MRKEGSFKFLGSRGSVGTNILSWAHHIFLPIYIFLIKYAESMQKVCSAKALLLVPIWYSSN